MRNSDQMLSLLVEMALLPHTDEGEEREHQIRLALAELRREAFMEHKIPEQPKARPLEVRCSETLLFLGVPASLKGFNYLKTAVQCLYEKPAYIEAITKRLYPEVARQHGTTASRVERAIRHAIERAYDNVGIEDLQHMLGNTVSMHKGKPTNSEFISIIVERMKMEEL